MVITQQGIGVGIIVLALIGFGFALWRYLAGARARAADAALRAEWEQDMAAYLPEGQGVTDWDWPEGHLAEYFFGDTPLPVYPGAGQPGTTPTSRRIDSSLDGPDGLPSANPPSPDDEPAQAHTSPYDETTRLFALDDPEPVVPIHADLTSPSIPDPFADDDSDVFIAAMRERTELFIAQLSQPQPIMAG